jgi:hypothetical protein
LNNVNTPTQLSMQQQVNEEKKEKLKMRERTVLQAREVLSMADKTVLKRKKNNFKAAASASEKIFLFF